MKVIDLTHIIDSDMPVFPGTEPPMLKGIGIDAISIDDIKSTTFAVHKILMPKDIIIIENLTNLDCISNEYFILSIMPLKNKDADGSPVRAISIEI